MHTCNTRPHHATWNFTRAPTMFYYFIVTLLAMPISNTSWFVLCSVRGIFIILLQNYIPNTSNLLIPCWYGLFSFLYKKQFCMHTCHFLHIFFIGRIKLYRMRFSCFKRFFSDSYSMEYLWHFIIHLFFLSHNQYTGYNRKTAQNLMQHNFATASQSNVVFTKVFRN